MNKILQNYPFKNLGISIAEGFTEYDGTVKNDVPGNIHNGIDYVLKVGKNFLQFEVFTMHDGEAFWGSSKMWGNFVVVKKVFSDQLHYYTVYAHLDNVNPALGKIPTIASKESNSEPSRGLYIPSYCRLGISGTSGDTQDIPQLHVELHEKDVQTGQRVKKDPYGIYDKASSKKYPKPGEPLSGHDHYWISDKPEFVR